MGTVNYLDALKLQDKLISRRKTHKISDTVLSLQHPPTYTLGKRRTDHNLLVPESDLKTIGAELHYTQRGGEITFHGPHQAILYPIISLRDIGLGSCWGSSILWPCGIADKEVTSLRRETDLVLPTEEVIHEQLISCFARLFGFSDLIWKEDAPILPDNGEAE
ncbi:Octanoyltransferase [Vitis vinifera]|uniref:lipoyl(octanoyl) transferase n=1 Tax=Vitis vinifera TaxID=29760 RepID=A0A438ELG2_VITVI|nr:Octanoyltransferase [Vitis vinifera]